MGVKSTIEFSRSTLEEMYVDKAMEIDAETRKRMFRAQAVFMADKDLEDAVERLNDQLHDGEGFENYMIV